ncbi:MAG: N-(5'-phosphoribosyl)anthranilate isomerase [Paracoccaceae bacterium]|nr:N-(5'-phosphoribosyl)anthranilate isomerase [Paracoccaceae bacterium]
MDTVCVRTSEIWLRPIFSAGSVRAARWPGSTAKSVGERSTGEVRPRGNRPIECGGQFVMVCTPDPIRVLS